jgi:hypothetical protein
MRAAMRQATDHHEKLVSDMKLLTQGMEVLTRENAELRASNSIQMQQLETKFEKQLDSVASTCEDQLSTIRLCLSDALQNLQLILQDRDHGSSSSSGSGSESDLESDRISETDALAAVIEPEQHSSAFDQH